MSSTTLTPTPSAASPNLEAPDLTAQAPRSLRARLGDYAILPRLLDKCRAAQAGSIGDYHTNCALDQEFLQFSGIDYEDLREQVARGLSDGAILRWIEDHASNQPRPWEIQAWSNYQNDRAPAPHTELSAYFLSVLAEHDKTRHDVRSWADLLDFDDYCSFGGRP